MDSLWSVYRAGLQPDPSLSVSEWADRHRYLAPAACPEPGRWRTVRTPYLREIMDRLGNDDPCQVVVFIAGSQVGKSECGINWLGWIADNSPGPTLMVQPTVEAAENFSKSRIAPTIAATPRLASIIADPRSRDSGNTTLSKTFAGGFWRIVGANAPIGLASTPIRRLFLDEVDRFQQSAGGEGDPIELAKQRTSNFGNRKIFITSTPTHEDESKIEAAYLTTDQRRYWVPCPECGEFQTLEWSGVKWEPSQPDTARYMCSGCGVLLPDHAKTQMLARGEWRPSAAGDGGKSVGYHLSSLYSPHGWCSWANLADDFLKAAGDPSKLQVFVNTKLGQVWRLADNDGIRRDGLQARAEAYGPELPAAVQVLTAGVDVQDDRIEIEVVGWGAGEESWGIAWHSIQGDPSAPLIWRTLDEYLRRDWPTAAGSSLSVTAACIDTGGHHTLAAYAFCKGKESRMVWPIKGRGGPGIPFWPRKASRNNKGKVALYILGVDAAKMAIYGRLRMDVAGPGYMHTPLTYPADWYTQVVAERKQTVYHKGHARISWVKGDHVRNEALDCRVYAFAALQGWLSRGHKLQSAAKVAVVSPVSVAPPPMPPHTDPAPVAAAPKPVQRKRGGWGDGRSMWAR